MARLAPSSRRLVSCTSYPLQKLGPRPRRGRRSQIVARAIELGRGKREHMQRRQFLLIALTMRIAGTAAPGSPVAQELAGTRVRLVLPYAPGNAAA
jgi:hypothetical protein